MANVRKLLRDNAYSLLSDGTTGFNARYSSVQTAYAALPRPAVIPSVTITWTHGSGSFIESYIEGPEIEASQLFKPYALALYTKSADNTNRGQRSKGLSFSGTVDLCLDFYRRKRWETGSPGVELDDTESFSDAVQDVLLSIFNASSPAWSHGIVWNGDYVCDPDPIVLFSDGFLQRIPSILTFEVHV